MKGDFSRLADFSRLPDFSSPPDVKPGQYPLRHFEGWLHQQGRVWLDADWNADVLTRLELRRLETQDIIGECGVPDPGTGFQIAPNPSGDPQDFVITQGRFYVHGVLCQLDADTSYLQQADYPHAPTLGSLQLEQVVGGLIYLETWRRLITYVEDDRVREIGLDGPDTTAALQTVAQVKVRLFPGQQEGIDCERDLPDDGHGTLSTLPVSPTVPAEGCRIPDPSTYTGRENHLYRVEIHDGGDVDGSSQGFPFSQTLAQKPDKGSTTLTLSAALTSTQVTALQGSGVVRLIDDRGRSEGVTVTKVDGATVTLAAGLSNSYTTSNYVVLTTLARFKWSRDNASFAVRVVSIDSSKQVLTLDSLPRDQATALRQGDLVEISDDATDLGPARGHLTYLSADPDPDQLTVTLLDPLPSDFPLGPNVKLRRWDGVGQAHATFDPANTPDMNLGDGIHIQFGGYDLRPGVYWCFAARAIDGSVEHLDNTPPQGIIRYRCPLAVVHWSWRFEESPGGPPKPVLSLTIDHDCRTSFPSLTHICAEDVCFDNTRCELVDVVTVQDALERLCEEKDLRFHNKHLHGWGVVCGLQVTCGPDQATLPRTHVTVHQGYAIDRDGNDIQLSGDETVDVLDKIKALGPNSSILDAAGNGEVCLILGLDAKHGHVINIEKYQPPSNEWQSLLAETLLLDMYNDCITRIQDFLEEQLKVPPDEKDLPAGPVTQRAAAFSNLLAQGVINPQLGQRLFLSKREDAILRDFYMKLRAILQSETFCAMFDNARPYPDYPEALDQMDTIFAKGEHERLRLRPGGREAYSMGPGLGLFKPSTTINRYDLQRGVLLSQIDPIAGTEVGSKGMPSTTQATTDSGAGSVQDVAFSPDGQHIYVVAPTRNDENTFFRVGDFDPAGNLTWRPIVTICGVKLVTLATTAADKTNVYAIGMTKGTKPGGSQVQVQGLGLYKITPDNVDPNMKPAVGFNSVGHLIITPDGRAFASVAANGADATVYTAIAGFQLPNLTPLFNQFPVDPGSDDIAVFLKADGAATEVIYVVTGPAQGVKTIRVYGMDGKPIVGPAGPVNVPDTVIRLQPYPPTRMLLMTWEDDYSVRLADMRNNTLVPDYLLPMEVNPLAIAADIPNERVYVLNYLNNTVTTANGKLFQQEYRFPIQTLVAYRKQAIEAFADLAAGFLQYLKDCLCEHFLVKCPECTGDEKLYLGCVSIRNNEVYKICSFTGRKMVGSFPTWGYWLSLVPVLPLLHRVIEEFCCLVLPDIFRYTVPEFKQDQTFTGESPYRGSSLRAGVAFVQGADLSAVMRDLIAKVQTTGNVFGRVLQQPAARATLVTPGIMMSDIVGQTADEAATRLKNQNVDVQHVPFQAAQVPDLAANATSFFRPPSPGGTVTLYEEGGKVVYYSVATPDAIAQELRARVSTLSDAAQARDVEMQQLRSQVDVQSAGLREVDTLKTALASTQETLNQRQAELDTLRTQFQDLQRQIADVANQTTPARVLALETELANLRSFRDEVQRFMQQQPPA